MAGDRKRPITGTEETIAPISGTEATVAPSPGYDETINAPPGAPGPSDRPRTTRPPVESPFPKTITAPPGVLASAETVTADSVSRAPITHRGVAPAGGDSRPGTSGVRTPTRSTVGNEMLGANIERFSTVGADRFEVLDELARGGLGRVFRARDPRTGRIVAIKEVLSPHEEIIARFAREALVTANLQHPAIVPVYEVGRWPGGEPFLAMKLVEGRTLDALIKEARPLNARLALVPHVITVADALAYAHSEHVIHRDLKPANILVGAYGETVVIDWGLAKNLETGVETEALPLASTLPPGAPNETVAGSVLGTPAYMPPEQARGEQLDERADVYAVGAILYHLLGGERPYAQAKTLDELIELVKTSPPAPLAQRVPDAPGELLTIVAKAMARAPEDRYPTAEGLAEDLRKFTAGKLVGAHQYTTWELVKRWVALHKATVGIAAAALVLLIVVGAVSAVRITQERDEADRQRRAALLAKDEEQEARGLAEQRYRDSLLELARQEIAANDPARALTLAVGAAGTSTDTASAALDVVLTHALGEFTGLVQVVPPLSLANNIGAFAPDARRLYFASTGNLVRAWDTVAREVAWEKQLAYAIRLSPDGTQLLGANKSGEVVVASAADGTRRAAWPLGAPDGQLPGWLAWAPDGTHFAASGAAGVWLGAVGRTQLVHPAAGDVWAIEFSPNSKRLATCGKDGRVQIHDSETGALLAAFTGLEEGCWSLAWDGDDRVLAGDKSMVRAWNVTTKQIERRFAQAYAYQIVPGGTPTEPWLLTCGDGAIARIWNPTTGALLHELGGHELGCDVAVAYEPWVVTSDEKGHVFVWDPRTGERLVALPVETTIRDLDVQRGYLAVMTSERSLLWKLDPQTRLQRITAHTARIRDLVFDSIAAVWTASNDGTVRGSHVDGSAPIVLGAPSFSEPTFVDMQGDVARTPPNPQGARSVTLSPDRRTVVTTYEDGAIRAWNATTGELRATWTGHTGRVRRVVFTADGAAAFSVGDTTLRKWDPATGAQVGVQELGGGAFELALFDAERAIATLTDANAVAVWSTADLARTSSAELTTSAATLPTFRDRLILSDQAQLLFVDRRGTVVASSTMQSTLFASVVDVPERGWVAAGAINGIVSIADAQSGALLRTFSHPSTAPITAIAFNPDGTLIATLSDRRVWLWDAATGSLLATSPQLPAFVFKLAWSTGGTQLAIAGGSGTVWVWRVTGRSAPAELATFARCASPWRLRDARLERAPFDPAACNALPAIAP